MARVKCKTEELTFDEVREYAENCGYELTERYYDNILIFKLRLFEEIRCWYNLDSVVDAIKNGELLNFYFCSLPSLPLHAAPRPKHK